MPSLRATSERAVLLCRQQAAEYSEKDFEKMLDEENVEVLVVTTVDATHDRYISTWVYGHHT